MAGMSHPQPSICGSRAARIIRDLRVIVSNGVDGFKSGERGGTESEIHKLIGVPTPLSPGYILFLFSPRFFVNTAILMSIPPSL